MHREERRQLMELMLPWADLRGFFWGERVVEVSATEESSAMRLAEGGLG